VAISPTQIATAAEAINRHPELSGTARRVALELLNHADRTTGKAWPSEARLATALGVTDRSIRRAKVELAEHGLLTWQRRGTSKAGRTNLYALAWDVLLSLAASIKAKVKAAAIAARKRLRVPSGVPQAPVHKPSNGASHPFVDRTKASAYLTQFRFMVGGKVAGTPPTKPQGQVLTDQQLDGRAQARVYDALRQLGQAALAQFLARPDAADLEAAAIKAERYNKGSALAFLAERLRHEVTA
jgi:Helix-turn-helix domain